jgi:hypothetical protein
MFCSRPGSERKEQPRADRWGSVEECRKLAAVQHEESYRALGHDGAVVKTGASSRDSSEVVARSEHRNLDPIEKTSGLAAEQYDEFGTAIPLSGEDRPVLTGALGAEPSYGS